MTIATARNIFLVALLVDSYLQFFLLWVLQVEWNLKIGIQMENGTGETGLVPFWVE